MSANNAPKAVGAGSIADAESKVKAVEEAFKKASKEWEAFGATPMAASINAKRAISTADLTEVVVGLNKLLRGTVGVIVVQQAAIAAVLQALKAK